MAAPQPLPVLGRPVKWRVLGVLTGPTADAIVEGDQRGLGAIEEIFELPGTEAEVHVIKYPRLEDLSAQLQGWKPNFVYVYGGVNGDKRDLEKQAISHLSFLVDQQGRFVEAALHLFLASFGGLHLDTVYFDAQGCAQIGEALHAAGVPNVVVWPREMPPLCLPAMHFAHAFFCMLRNRSMTVPEAYAMACHVSKAHCSQPPPEGAGAGPLTEPQLPRLLSRVAPGLPGMASIPPLILGGRDVSGALAAAVPGYDQVRLLAPNAELRMLACGLSGLINPQSLAYLGEALRALLATEARRLVVQRVTPCEKAPDHLPPGSGAIRCELDSFSGAAVTVVLGGPVDVLQNHAVVEHALRQTMVADAHSLQIKLPPPNVPLPASRTNAAVAGGAPVVEVLMVTSVWCVQLLKVLCQYVRYRGLVALGIGAVSNSPVASFTKADANRYTSVVTNNDPTKLLQASTQGEGATAAVAGTAAGAAAAAAFAAASPPGLGVGPASVTQNSEAPLSGSPAAAQGVLAPPGPQAPPGAPRPLLAAAAGSTPVAAAGALQGNGSFVGQLSAPGASAAQAGSSAMGSQGVPGDARGRSESPEHTSADADNISNPVRLARQMHVAPWRSSRPHMKQCGEEQFMSDLIAFLTDRQGRQIDPKAFPEAVLNGSRLDLFNLYKEVCNRGGYQVGNGINWKGQVFPRMRNYTAQHKMTGVGNALKRHYQMFLLEYEHAHPEDVNGGQCALCGHGEEVGTDWISCDMCDCWVHFSCDRRPFLGSFKEYSRGRTRTYCCPRCYEIKRQRSMQQQQMEEAAAGGGAGQEGARAGQEVKTEGDVPQGALGQLAEAPAQQQVQQAAGGGPPAPPAAPPLQQQQPQKQQQAATLASAPAMLVSQPMPAALHALAGAQLLPGPPQQPVTLLPGVPAPQAVPFPIGNMSQLLGAQPGPVLPGNAPAFLGQQQQQFPGAAAALPQAPAAGQLFSISVAPVHAQQQQLAQPVIPASAVPADVETMQE